MARRVDLLNGSIPGSLTRLALPIMFTSLIQMTYNMTDMIWIGRVGAGAVASVGAAGMFTWLASGLVVLARMGGQVMVGQSLGAGDREAALGYARGSVQLGAAMALLYTLLVQIFSGSLISFFGLSSPQIIADAELYLRLVSLGLFFSFMGQILSNLITVSGNSRTPLYATATGLGLNILLDPLLIFGVGPFPRLGVAGAALATVMAQAIVFLVLALYCWRDHQLFGQLKPFSRPDFSVMKHILRISLPSALQASVFPLISMVIARLVASWGDAGVAVQQVGGQIESISWMTADGFSVAVNSFVAQNYGARNYERAQKGYWTSMVIVVIWGIFCSLLLALGAVPIFRFFIPDESVLGLGTAYLRIIAAAELFMCVEIVTAGAFSGFGKTLPPSLVSIIFTAARIPMALLLSSTALGLDGIWWSVTISSILKGVVVFLLFIRFMRRLGKENAAVGESI